MKVYGASLPDTGLENLVTPSGNTFPPATKGELFYLTGTNEGLYFYNGSGWIRLPTKSNTSPRILNEQGRYWVPNGTAATTTAFLGSTRAYSFSATADNQIAYCVEIPEYDPTYGLIPYVHWAQSATTTGNIVCTLSGYYYSLGTVGTAIATQTLTIACDTTKNIKEIVFSSIGNAIPSSTNIVLQFSRLGTNANDTHASANFVVGFGLKYKELST